MVFVVCCLLYDVGCLSCVVCYSVFAVCFALCVVRCLPFVVFGVCCMLCVVRLDYFMFLVAGCLPLVTWRLLFVVHCAVFAIRFVCVIRYCTLCVILYTYYVVCRLLFVVYCLVFLLGLFIV